MLLPFLLGLVTGMRTMTATMVLCWFAWLGLLNYQGTWAFWTANVVSVVVFTLLGVGEYYGDVQPQTPSRKAPALVLGRLSFGALVGALASVAVREPFIGGAICGMIGALVGTLGGYRARMGLARRLGRDLPAGLIESTVALTLAVACAYRLHHDEALNMLIEPLLYR